MFKIFPLQEISLMHAKYHERDTCLMVRREDTGQWRKISWLEANAKVQALAEGLVKMGVGVGENVGIFSENYAEFIYTDLALLAIRAVGIPLYSTLSAEQVRFIAQDSGIKYLFVGGQQQYDTAYLVSRELGIRLIAYSHTIHFHTDDRSSLFFDDVLMHSVADKEGVLAQQVAERRLSVKPDDTAFILYTSGTGGDSKGVLISHESILAQVKRHAAMPGMKAQRISFDFLPLTHIFEKMWCLLCLECNIIVAVNSDPHQVTETLPEVRPHYFCNVPRFWEKVYFGVLDKLDKVSAPLSRAMQDCIATAKTVWIDYKAKGLPVPAGLRLKYSIYDKTLLSLLRKKVGLDRGIIYPVSGASLSKEIHAFLLALGIPIVYGYGMTETTATVAYQLPGETRLGSVGRLVSGVEVRIDEAAGGELLVKGISVMKGYYNRPEDNAKNFTEDGFFRTGDLMCIDEDNYLYFKERSKDLYKTANGKYIAPQLLENRILSEGIAEQALIIADRRNFVSALIYPNWPKVTSQLSKVERNDLDLEDTERLRKDPAVYDLIESHISKALADLAGYEQVKKFIILSEPFSIRNGLLTSSMKSKRSAILEHYKKEIDDLYGYAI